MSNDKKIALVTGSTRGIGLETARQLASQGVHVLLAGRDADRAAAAAAELSGQGLPVEPIVLDVADTGSIAAAAAEVAEKFGRLDILINNAGIFKDDFAKTPSEQSLEVWRETFDTNLFGMVAVTQALLPLLRKSPAGRIVNLSSGLASLTFHSDPNSELYDFKVPAYNVSKTAVNAWTVQLAHELRNTAIKVNAADPGSVKTDMNSNGQLELADGASTSVGLALLDEAGPTGTFQHRGEVLPW